MKKFAMALMVCLATLFVSGCQGRTRYGECVGVMDNDEKKPDMEYKMSVRNAVFGVLFVEMVWPAAIWVLTDLECPIGPKQK